MSFNRVSKYHISTRSLTSSAYVRPSDWISNPIISEATQAFQGVYAIYDNGANYCSLMFTTSTGNYQVNWGDGTTEQFASGVQADHVYTYSTVIGLGNPVSSRGYTTVLVIVTSVSGNLLTMDLHRKNAAISTSYYVGAWLDLQVNAQYLTSINSPSSQIVYFYNTEIFTINNNALSVSNYLCYSFYKLQIFIFLHSIVTSSIRMFSYCTSLISISLFDLSLCSDASGMFSYCTSLISVPLFNLSSCSAASGMFYNCKSLQAIACAPKVSFNITNCNLSVSALNTLYTNLPSVTSQTITQTNCPGSATATKTIATNKGWTIVG